MHCNYVKRFDLFGLLVKYPRDRRKRGEGDAGMEQREELKTRLKKGDITVILGL